MTLEAKAVMSKRTLTRLCLLSWLQHLLAEYAVHAGMSGKTNLVIGYWNNFFTHVPIHLATKERRMVDLDSALWRGVMSATQQDKTSNINTNFKD